MRRTFSLFKLPKAKVAGAALHYKDSFGIDPELLETMSILVNKQVHTYNINYGKQFPMYAMPGEYGSSFMSANETSLT